MLTRLQTFLGLNNLPRASYVHLVWLLYLFIQPLFDSSFGVASWLLTALALALFLPAYFWMWRQRGRRLLVGAFTLALLGLAFAPVNSGTSGFFIYAAAAIGTLGQPRTARRCLLVVFALLGLSALLSPIPWPYLLFSLAPVAVMTLIIGLVTIFETEEAKANRRLDLAHEEIERLAKIAERERIARDLHDLLGHTLSVITLKSDLAVRLVGHDDARAGREMEEVARVSRQALKEVREAVRGYRLRSLQGELEAARDMCVAAGLAFDYLVKPPLLLGSLPPAQETVLALALREAVTNVTRHAAATHCTVRLLSSTASNGCAEVSLEVEDDGRGKDAPDGAGLSGMRERVALLGGRLSIAGRSPGTRLVLRLQTPLAAPEARPERRAARVAVALEP